MKEYENERARAYVVNSKTGEITNELFPGDKIVKVKQSEYVQNNYANFQKGKGFTKTFDSVVMPLYIKLSAKEFAIAMALKPLISYGDGILRYEGKYATSKDISIILQEDYGNIKRNISKLIEYEVLKRIEKPSELRESRKKKCLVANPYIYMRGQDIETDTVKMFMNTYWASL